LYVENSSLLGYTVTEVSEKLTASIIRVYTTQEVLGKPSNCRAIKCATTYPLLVPFAKQNDNGKVL
jgi:hypothetical protein